MIRKDTIPDLYTCAINFDWDSCKKCPSYRDCIEIRKDKDYQEEK